MPLSNEALVDAEYYRKELKDRESEIRLLQETFRQVASELDLEKIYKIVADRAIQLVEAESIIIPILDHNQKTYTYRGGAGINVDEIIGESMPLEFGICGWVWKNKRAWWRGILDELDEHERNRWEKEAGTLVMVPLQGRKSFLGGIAAINKKDGLEFSRRDVEMLGMFAGIVSIAIENAFSFQQLQNTQETLIEHQHRLERLNKQHFESSRKIEQLSLYDSLTDLPNRTLFNDRLNTELKHSKRENLTLGLILLNINNFKTLNDALGHDIGDNILIEFCKRIMHQIGPDLTLSRLGGDEFILLIPETSKKATVNKAISILKEIEKPYKINEKDIALNASTGICIYPEHGEDKSSLIRHADIALRIAKKNHNPYHVFDSKIDSDNDNQLSLAMDINEAFLKDQFELYYQPKIDIKSNTLISAEALGRWKHPEKGFISPGIFIEALEQNNMIDRYTFDAIKKAITSIEKWTSEGHNIKIAINISTQTLMNTDFVSEIQSIFTDFSISRRIIFEITESLFLSDNEQVMETLTHIRALGIELSIDDFGTGYSSLSRLKRLPVNELKIDQSFIKDMNNNLDDQIIVKSIIDLAHNLGLSVVAEGVETRPVLERLKNLGCDIAQGYLISRPMSTNDFDTYLSKN